MGKIQRISRLQRYKDLLKYDQCPSSPYKYFISILISFHHCGIPIGVGKASRKYAFLLAFWLFFPRNLPTKKIRDEKLISFIESSLKSFSPIGICAVNTCSAIFKFCEKEIMHNEIPIGNIVVKDASVHGFISCLWLEHRINKIYWTDVWRKITFDLYCIVHPCPVAQRYKSVIFF